MLGGTEVGILSWAAVVGGSDMVETRKALCRVPPWDDVGVWRLGLGFWVCAKTLHLEHRASRSQTWNVASSETILSILHFLPTTFHIPEGAFAPPA